MPRTVSMAAATAPTRPEDRFTPLGRFIVEIEHLRFWPGSCSQCSGPAPRLTLDVDPMLLSSGHRPAANYEAVNGYMRFFAPNLCSACELKQLLRELFPTSAAPAIESPVEAELRRLRQELAERPAPEAPSDALAAAGGLFDLGKVLVTPSAGRAVWRCATGRVDETIGPYQWNPHVLPLIERHAKGDHGLVGWHGDGDVELGSGGNPLSSVLDRNVAAIAEGIGSVRSVYQLTRMETRRTGELGTRTTALAERVEIGVRSELGIGVTLVGLSNEVQGQT